jgi:colanic acid biosynthesis glycosyl transferase WcaI
LKILVTSLYFYPDHSGIALYSSDFAFYAAEQGHQVKVVTGYSFYPKWKKRDEDKLKFFTTEKKNNVEILRGYISVPKIPTTLTRVIQEATFCASALISYFKAGRPDVIVAFTTPISIGFLAAIFKRILKCKLLINVQDFQLEAAASLGMANQGSAFKILSLLENNSYRSANAVSSISESMCNLLSTNKKLSDSKIYYWPNWIDVDKYQPDASRKGNFRKNNNIDPQKKIVAYAGNIGLKQGLDSLVDLAEAYKHNNTLQFLIIGEGAGAEQLKEYASSKAIPNLLFIPLLNPEQYLDFLADLDIFFLSQKKTQFDVYFPSKLLGLMAAEKLLLLSADAESELYKTVKKNNIGLVSEYGDVNSLIEQLDKLINDNDIAKSLYTATKKYVQQFDRGYVLNNVLKKLSDL